MPSFSHEALLYLFRQCPTLAPDLLRDILGQPLPKYSQVQIDSENLTDIQPSAFHADLVVLLLTHHRKAVHGIVVEVQRSSDPDKLYSWPSYAANLRARHRVESSVLVVCDQESTARWAAQPIPLGGGNFFTPQVLGPSAVPAVTDREQARREPELAVFSAMAHGQDLDARSAARIVSAAQAAIVDLDTDRGRIYFDLIWASISEAVKRELQAMDPAKYEYQSDFAKRFFAEGKAEGETEGERKGRVGLVLRLLARRFGPLDAEVSARLAGSSLEELDAIGERLLTAQSLAEALGR